MQTRGKVGPALSRDGCAPMLGAIAWRTSWCSGESPRPVGRITGQRVRRKLYATGCSEGGVQTRCSTPGSPWENGSLESFNGTCRDELLDRELVETLWEGKGLTERGRQTYNNQIRPHRALGDRPPAPEALVPREA